MSNYTKTTNFAAKDSLPSGNAGKIVKGTEIDAEFNNIATASATKANINDATLTGTTTFGSLNDGTITIAGWVDEDNMSSNSAVLIPTQQSVKAYVDTNVTAQDLDVTDGSASIDIDLDSESLGILGGTGVTSTASGTGVTLAIDSTVATLTGSQTLTNKTLTTPTILTSFTIGSATISEAELEILDGATVTTAELNVLDGITSTTAELNILDGVTSNAAEINILDGVTSTTAELNILDGVTATAAEINILTGYTGTTADLNTLDGVTASAAELNILDGATVTTAEVNILDGVTSTAAELNILDGVTSTAAELNILDGVTSTTAELNILDGVTSTAVELNILDGVTSTTAELNILDGVTSTATELNLLDGVTSTTAELNYTDGVTSAIQTQLDGKISGTDAALTGNATITTSDNTTQLALISTDADANAGPILDLFRNSVSAADNDLAGQVYFSGNNDADEKTFYGQITSQILDVSNGSEDFALELSTLTAGASNSRLFISPTETVFNESSADLDFRIESDGNTNAFFLEGSSGNVSLSNNLTVTGALAANGGAVFNEDSADVDFRVESDGNTHALFVEGSSGNVLVGGTSSSITAGSISLEAQGRIRAGRSGGTVLQLNRTTSDGDVAIFYKDGSSVGSIGTGSGLLTIGKGTGNLVFENALVAPCSDSSVGSSNGVVDLGTSSRRFKDIYLSGSVSLTNANATNEISFTGTEFTNVLSATTSGFQLGTTGAGYLSFLTNNAERMRITSTGVIEITGPGGAGETFLNFTADSNTTKAQISGAKAGASGGKLSFSTNNSSGTLTAAMLIDSAGRVTMPLQPSFSVRPASSQADIAINGERTVVFGSERFDVGANFTGNTFTAPVTGKYQLNYQIELEGVDNGAAYVFATLKSSNANYRTIIDPSTFDKDAAYWSLTGSALADMDASDTVYIYLYVGGGAAQVDINAQSTFTGILVG